MKLKVEEPKEARLRELARVIRSKNAGPFLLTLDVLFPTSELTKGKIRPCGPVPDLTAQEVDRSVRIVAQMGTEPFISALDAGAEVVVAGRACDTSIFAAIPQRKSMNHGRRFGGLSGYQQIPIRIWKSMILLPFFP